jgi:DNA-binding CsgD family transcriptional regulator
MAIFELLGMDSTAERVYREMLRNPDGQCSELAAALDIAESDVRGAWDQLAGLSLLTTSSERVGHMRPLPPRVGLEVMLAHLDSEMASFQQRIDASRAAAAALIARHPNFSTGRPFCEVEEVLGVDKVRDRIRELAQQASIEIAAFAPGGGQSEVNLAVARIADERLLKRGIQMRTIYLESARSHSPTFQYAHWLMGLGAEVRLAPALPVRMLLLDRRIAVMPVDPDNSGSGILVLNGTGAVTAICALFDDAWANAAEFSEHKPHDTNGLTAQQREAARLLLAGYTDEVVARRLGVSVRTARRMASQLMELLGAQSRFQAGYRLAEQGWLAVEAE